MKIYCKLFAFLMFTLVCGTFLTAVSNAAQNGYVKEIISPRNPAVTPAVVPDIKPDEVKVAPSFRAAEFGDLLFQGSKGKKQIAITFDDGPGKSTKEILELLDKHGVKATFFMLGDSLKVNKEMAKKVSDAGHLIANHTFTHKNWVKMDEEKYKALVNEIINNEDLIYKTTGQMPVFMRMPYGVHSQYIAKAAKNTGHILVNWTFCNDWQPNTKEDILKLYKEQIKDGAVLLFHDGGPYKSKLIWVLDNLLAEIKKQGYSMPVLNTVLNVDMASLKEQKAKIKKLSVQECSEQAASCPVPMDKVAYEKQVIYPEGYFMPEGHLAIEDAKPVYYKDYYRMPDPNDGLLVS